jgi:hypothetical protein
MGVLTHTCTKCGAEDTEYIPTLHAQGDCFEYVGGTEPTCTEEGKKYYTCNICDYTKFLITKPHHENTEYVEYQQKSETVHEIYCSACDTVLDSEKHVNATEYTNTCTEDGYAYEVCIYCGYSAQGEAQAAHGHNMKNGDCTACDYSENPTEPDVPVEPEVMIGDLTGDGKINLADMFPLKSYIMGEVELNATEMKAANINGDDKVNLADLFAIKTYLATGSFN